MSNPKKIIVYYWSEDEHSQQLEKFIELSLTYYGYEVIECWNLSGRGTGWHGKPMVNAFKQKELSRRFQDNKDMVEAVLGRLFKDIQTVKCSQENSDIDIQLFVIHIDGEMFGDDVDEGERIILDKVNFVLDGYKMVHVKSEIGELQSPLKLMAVIPVKEFENWLIHVARMETGDTSPIPNPVDQVEDAKEKVNACLTGASINLREDIADPLKATLIESLDFNALIPLSPSFRNLSRSIQDTTACIKGNLIAFRNHRRSE